MPTLPAAAEGTDPIAPRRPTAADLEAARGKSIPDVIAPGLDVLFVGINPSLWSGAVGQHFARPGNRFWRALHEAGLTDRLLSPADREELLRRKIGITNLVNRATASADELEADELRRGARRVKARVRRYRPKVVAFVGMGAYRVAFGRPRARGGRQAERVGDVTTWVLPNPSGRTAGYQMPALTRAFRDLRRSLRRGTLTSRGGAHAENDHRHARGADRGRPAEPAGSAQRAQRRGP
ncbi:MAG TPA: G/U mismatch-specific DNA glycosylase [Candidatus Limnocylindria bacterium]|nr:G/U mismatch-specific DNA glycosylase [Candidatus Limnocylindria bacterium]